MYSLTALLVVAAATCICARPPADEIVEGDGGTALVVSPMRERGPPPPPLSDLLRMYLRPRASAQRRLPGRERLLAERLERDLIAPEDTRVSRVVADPMPLVDSPLPLAVGRMPPEDVERMLLPPPTYAYDWLSKEIERLSLLENDDDTYDAMALERSKYDLGPPLVEFPQTSEEKAVFKRMRYPNPRKSKPMSRKKTQKRIANDSVTHYEFAFTPRQGGFFSKREVPSSVKKAKSSGTQMKLYRSEDTEFEKPRRTRQNPTLSKTKTLIADNLDKLSSGNGALEEAGGKSTPRLVHVVDATKDPSHAMYDTVIIIAVAIALAFTVVGFMLGWYSLSKKAKAAADVEYPAYGVTGPTTMDAAADRRLAHSAHMYHYQHQKQQILAMERHGAEHRNGSVSEPESEEENEEGDYTVYECPGFATSGDMEVKNPMFSDEPTPATPGKCEIFKPQPKE